MRAKLSPTTSVLLIRLCLLAGVVAVIWPLPRAIAFQSSEPGVLGRYTLTYFVLLMGLIGLAVVWLSVTIWGWWRLNEPSLERLRRWLDTRSWLLVVVPVSGVLALSVLRFLDLTGPLGYPPSLATTMQVVPGLMVGTALLLVALMMDDRHRDLLDESLGMLDVVRGQGWLIWLLVGVLAALLPLSVLRSLFWDYPLSADGSAHVYVGRLILNGGQPWHSFVVEYAPMRYVISMVWNLIAQGFSLPAAHVGRGWNLLMSLGVLICTYGIGKKLTGRPSTGVLALVTLLGVELLHDVVIGGPIFRLTTAFLLALTLWFGVNGRWFWGAAVGMLAMLVYPPSLLVMVGLGIAALFSTDKPRWPAVRNMALGAGAVLLPTVLILLVAGLANDAFRYVVLSVVRSGDTYSAGSGLLNISSRFLGIKWSFRGDWELLALTLVGTGLLFVIPRSRKEVRAAGILALLASAGLMIPTLLIDEAAMADVVLRMLILVPLGAAGLEHLFILLVGDRWQRLSTGLRAFGIASVLLIGMADTIDQIRWDYAQALLTLNDQTELVEDTEVMLNPDDTVWSLFNVWYPTLSGRAMPVPLRRFDYKAALVEISGWSPERVISVMETSPPAIVLWLGPRPDLVADWLTGDYEYLGIIEFDGMGFPQEVWVLKGREEVRAVLEVWPLIERPEAPN